VFEEYRDLDMQKLRQETHSDHQAIEGTSPLMLQNLSIAEYVQCLRGLYGVVAAWEERAPEVAPEWLQPTLVARQRKHLLQRDLASFGELQDDQGRSILPDMPDLPSLLGTMYVIEGSTLGGQYIARHVETVLPLSEGRGSSYFRGKGSQTGQMWKEFCEILKTRISDEQTDAVVISAKAMFRTFGTWMTRKSAMNGS
jgi:heme oxygenase